MNRFFKFPHTPHLYWLSPGTPRDDKVLSADEAECFLSGPLVVEEKIDGANLGFSVRPDGSLQVQNRGTILGPRAHPQFSPVWPWLAPRQHALVKALGRALILFGEWCFAVHSVRYDRLPDWFLAFDVYDLRHSCFWSTRRRDELCRNLGVHTVPHVGEDRFDRESLVALLGNSAFTDCPMEGIYLRREDDDRLRDRSKLVRPQFLQAIEEHWTKRKLVRNRLRAS